MTNEEALERQALLSQMQPQVGRGGRPDMPGGPRPVAAGSVPSVAAPEQMPEAPTGMVPHQYGNQPGFRPETAASSTSQPDSRWDAGAVAQMDAIWKSQGKTLDDAAKDRWAGKGGYLYKQGEATGAGQQLKPFETGDTIEEYWKGRMIHDANGTEHDPEGVARARMRQQGTAMGTAGSSGAGIAQMFQSDMNAYEILQNKLREILGGDGALNRDALLSQMTR